MADSHIQPHRVTKPIQLLAAWLVGLVFIDSIFLTAACKFEQNSWGSIILVIAAIINVPIFLGALFLLQTRFRAELQEDSFYSEYINKKTSTKIKVEKSIISDAKLSAQLEEIEKNLAAIKRIGSLPPQFNKSGLDWRAYDISLNGHHPEANKIRKVFKAANMHIAKIFTPDAKPPKMWVVAINVAMPLEHKIELLKILSQFRMDGFAFWNPDPAEGDDSDVYIGSYSEYEMVPFDGALKDFLADDNDNIDLQLYCGKHSKAMSTE